MIFFKIINLPKINGDILTFLFKILIKLKMRNLFSERTLLLTEINNIPYKKNVLLKLSFYILDTLNIINRKIEITIL